MAQKTSDQVERDLWLILLGTLMRGQPPKEVLDLLTADDCPNGDLRDIFECLLTGNTEAAWARIDVLGIAKGKTQTVCQAVLEALRQRTMCRRIVETGAQLNHGAVTAVNLHEDKDRAAKAYIADIEVKLQKLKRLAQIEEKP